MNSNAITTAIIVAAISFILQKTLSNIIYGIVIFFTKPFKRGDKVSIKHFNQELASGKIVSIGPLHIKIKDYNRDVAILPNSLLESCTIINSDYKNGVNYINRIKITFDSDIKKAKNIILNTIVERDDTQNTEKNTHIINKISEGGMIIEYNVRTSDIDTSFDVCSDIAEYLILKFNNEKNITVV